MYDRLMTGMQVFLLKIPDHNKRKSQTLVIWITKLFYESDKGYQIKCFQTVVAACVDITIVGAFCFASV